MPGYLRAHADTNGRAARTGSARAPGADAPEPPPLLAGGPGVAAGGPGVEAVCDPRAVLLGVVVVELELGADGGDVQPQTADAGEHPAVGRGTHGHLGVVAGGLEVRQLPDEQLGLRGRFVDDRGSAA